MNRNKQSDLGRASDKWMVVHEFGAPSHYTALKFALQSRGSRLHFVEFNFYSQLKAIIKRRKGQIHKSIANLKTFLQFAFTGARGWHIVIGIAPYNSWLILLRWILRNATVSLHTSWPYWDGSKQPHKGLIPCTTEVWRKFVSEECKVVLIATTTAKSNFESSKYSGRPISVVAHSLDPEVFYPEIRECAAPKNVLYVGRFEYSKGVHMLLQMAKLRSDYRFSFVGYGPMQSDIEEASRQLRNVNFIGEIKDRHMLATEMRSQDVLLLPSIRVPEWEELFGMVLVEAMACGMVPISTDHVGPKEILANVSSQLLLSEECFAKEAFTIMDCWRINMDKYCDLRDACIKYSSNYSIENISKRWVDALEIGKADGR